MKRTNRRHSARQHERRQQHEQPAAPARAVNNPSRIPGVLHPRPAAAVAWALALATFALYLPSLFNDFVQLDDPQYVLDNPVVQRGITAEGVRWAFTTTRFANWLPVTWLSHMLDCELFGLWAGGHHLSSAALHAANAALVFLLLRAMTGSLWRSAAVAALFAAHPLRVESVAWVAERKDVLCATFGLLTMLAWVGYCRTGSPWRYAAALALYTLGLMSKTMIVTLPFLLLLLDVWPLRRVAGIGRFLPGRADAPARDDEAPAQRSLRACSTAPESRAALPPVGAAREVKKPPLTHRAAHDAAGAPAREGEAPAERPAAARGGGVSIIDDLPKEPSRRPGDPFAGAKAEGLAPFASRRWAWIVLEKLPLLALAAVASAWTASLQHSGGAMRLGVQLSLGQRLANAVVSIPRYLEKTVRPVDLSVFYPHPGSWPPGAVAASTALILVMTAAVLAPVRRRPYLAVGWFWFLGMLVPVAGVVQVGAQSMADRYTYLPGIGLLTAVVWGAADLARREPRLRAALRPATAALLAVFAVGTVLQQRYWAGTVELFEHAVAVNPDDWLAQGMLGLAFHNMADDARAVGHYEKAIAANPTHPDAMHNLGLSWQRLGRRAEAIAALRQAARHPPPRAVTHGQLGRLLAEQRDWPAADAAFAEAERLAPTAAVYPIGRGRVALEMKRPDVAAEHFRQALQLDPENADARRGLAEAGGTPGQ